VGSLGGAEAEDPGASTINAKKYRQCPLAGADGYPGAPTINVKNIDGGLPGPRGDPISIRDLKGVL
jgi:hypothetical protein